MKELEALLLKCNFEKHISEDYDFQEIENYTGFPLPSDYKYYLNNYEPFAGDIGQQYLQLYPFNELIETNEGYSVKEFYDLDTLMIGSNGGGEFIGISFFEGNYKLVLAPFIGNFDEDHIEIGSAFTDMLQRLLDGKEWFEQRHNAVITKLG